MNFEFRNISLIISTLAVIAIVSMDLGVPYNQQERLIYTNQWFQIMVLFAVAYINTEKINLTLITLGIWLLIKYFKK